MAWGALHARHSRCQLLSNHKSMPKRNLHAGTTFKLSKALQQHHSFRTYLHILIELPQRVEAARQCLNVAQGPVVVAHVFTHEVLQKAQHRDAVKERQ